MKLTDYSHRRIQETAARWEVPRDYFDPIYNYLVHGFEPGSFWSAVLANDFMAAMQHSHPGNQIPGLKNTVGWMQEHLPALSYGSWKNLQSWLAFTDQQRRSHLEAQGLIYTERKEVEMALRGTRVMPEPLLW